MSLIIRRLEAWDQDMANQIGHLRPDLSVGANDHPVSLEMLEEVVLSPYHDQYVAELHGQVVGAAAMSLTMGVMAAGRKAWLEDFVVSSREDVRGHGVGHELFWKGVISWCREKNAPKLEFHSHEVRKEAHKFYKRQGCIPGDTTPFKLELGLVT